MHFSSFAQLTEYHGTLHSLARTRFRTSLKYIARSRERTRDRTTETPQKAKQHTPKGSARTQKGPAIRPAPYAVFSRNTRPQCRTSAV